MSSPLSAIPMSAESAASISEFPSLERVLTSQEFSPQSCAEFVTRVRCILTSFTTRDPHDSHSAVVGSKNFLALFGSGTRVGKSTIIQSLVNACAILGAGASLSISASPIVQSVTSSGGILTRNLYSELSTSSSSEVRQSPWNRYGVAVDLNENKQRSVLWDEPTLALLARGARFTDKMSLFGTNTNSILPCVVLVESGSAILHPGATDDGRVAAPFIPSKGYFCFNKIVHVISSDSRLAELMVEEFVVWAENQRQRQHAVRALSKKRTAFAFLPSSSHPEPKSKLSSSSSSSSVSPVESPACVKKARMDATSSMPERDCLSQSLRKAKGASCFCLGNYYMHVKDSLEKARDACSEAVLQCALAPDAPDASSDRTRLYAVASEHAGSVMSSMSSFESVMEQLCPNNTV